MGVQISVDSSRLRTSGKRDLRWNAVARASRLCVSIRRCEDVRAADCHRSQTLRSVRGSKFFACGANLHATPEATANFLSAHLNKSATVRKCTEQVWKGAFYEIDEKTKNGVATAGSVA